MKAEQFLRQGAEVLAERGKEYDKPEGERSMGKTVQAFSAITGKDLTEAEGWLFMQILKDVRQWQNPDRYHEDSAVDGVNYSALKAEALSGTVKECLTVDEGWIEWQEGMKRPDDGVIVDIEWRDGVHASGDACNYNWATSDADPRHWHIVAYKIHKEIP